MSTPSGARDPGSATAMATPPPFHRLPVRAGVFGYLALLSSERERAVDGEAVGRIDSEILDVLNNQTLSGMAKIILTGEERTQVKIDKVLCQLSELIEQLAVIAGSKEWFAALGRSPYAPLYPPNLTAGDLTDLREMLINDLPE